MPEEAKPKPLSAEEGTEVPDPAPGPKGYGTLKKGVHPPQPLNAEPEDPDQNAGSGTGTKGQATWSKKVKPGDRG